MNDLSNIEPVTVSEPWLQQEDEPNALYVYFQTYLVLGIRRSLRAAYRIWLTENDPEVLIKSPNPTIPELWRRAYVAFNWEGRSKAYDQLLYSDSLKVLEQAAAELKNATLDAVETLKRELSSNRNAVAAAKEILDRAGVKTAAIQFNQTISSEDMARAEQELAEWNKTEK